MKRSSAYLSARVLRVSTLAAFIYAISLVGAATAARADGNIWTSHWPGGGFSGALAIDPTTPTTIYAGTSSGAGGQLLKSTDGGDTWGRISINNAAPIVVDPKNPSTLYGAAFGGVLKSTDGGGTWVAYSAGIAEASVRALVIDPDVTSTLYISTSTESCCGVYKSTDAGTTWGQTGPYLSIEVLAIDPATPHTLYAGSFGDGVFKTTDGGDTWSTAGLAYTYVHAFAIDPVLPSTVYVAAYTDTGGVFKSTDGGGIWESANAGLGTALVRALVIDPAAPSTLYAGTDASVFKSTDGGGAWDPFDTGLPSGGVLTVAIASTTPTTLHALAGSGVFSIHEIPVCMGDCGGDDEVSIDELVTMVSIALDRQQVASCPAGEVIHDGQITIDEVLTAVNDALVGCGH